MSDETVHTAEIVTTDEIPEAAAPYDMNAVRDYYAGKRADYLQRIGDIEAFLGFAISEEDLGARVAKLENFLKIPR